MIEYVGIVHLVILEYVVGLEFALAGCASGLECVENLDTNLVKMWDQAFLQFAGGSVLGAGAERAEHRMYEEWHVHVSEWAKGF